MKEKISWYIEKENKFLGKNVLAVCYNVTEEEQQRYGLTNSNILVLIKNDYFRNILDLRDIDIKKVIKQAFKNKKIFLRLQCECLLGIYGDLHCDCEQQRKEYLSFIDNNEGIYIHIPQEAQGHGLHYKLKELELQVNGHSQTGKFTGKKDRNTAFLEINNKKFEDIRKYDFVYEIINELGIKNNEFILLTDSKKKINEISNLNLKIEMYSTYTKKHVNVENASEYLVKILDGSFEYDNEVIIELCEIIKTRKYNERTINTFLKIIEKIKNNDNETYLNNKIKKVFIETYNSIICGVEKSYNFKDTKIVKIQNKFSCKVDNKLFGIIKKVFKENIFSRISIESSYLFEGIEGDSTIRIRHSRVLDINQEKSLFLKGQEYLQQITFEEDTKMVENEITKSKLKSYFENREYIYRKKIDMITFISENILDGINIYIKRIPNFDNHIMDIYGKKEKILGFIEKITKISNKIVLDSISNIQLEDENYIDSNLSFSDENTAINEELAIFNLIK